MNITLNSTEEEKATALARQNRLNKQYFHSRFMYYIYVALVIAMIIFCICECTGVTSISWFSKINNYIQ